MEGKKTTIYLFVIFFAVALIVSLCFNALSCLLPKPDSDGDDASKMQVAIARMQDNVLEIMGPNGEGTGFIVTKAEGGAIALSCHHVTKADSSMVAIKTRGQEEYVYGVAEVIDYCEDYDVSVIKISGEMQFVDLIKEGKMQGEATAGEQITLLGNCLGEGIKAFDGIVGASEVVIKCEDASHTNLNKRYLPAVHVTCAVNAGNSGGPIFNQDAELVGMGFYQVFGSQLRPVYDLSYAIPTQILKAIVDRALIGAQKNGGLTARIESPADSTEQILRESVTAEFRQIDFKTQINLVTGAITVIGGEHDGKTLQAIGKNGLQPSGLHSLCAAMLGYGVGASGDKLTVEFTDGTSAQFEARGNV